MHNKNICKLCGNTFFNKEMSEEHYPAKSVGNNDIVSFDVAKMFDNLSSQEFYENISTKVSQQGKLDDIMDGNFEKCIGQKIYIRTGELLELYVRSVIDFLENMMKRI